jgi:cytochrome c biogenesis factor
MIAEIGHYALVLAFGLALVQGTLPLLGAARGDAGLIALARSSALGQFVFVSVAFGALIHAFATSDFSVILAKIDQAQGPNYVARRATSEITRAGEPVATPTPEKRFYPVERQATTEARIDTGLFRDLYVVVGDPVDEEKASSAHTVRIYRNPLVMWIWGGVTIMGLAGVLSLSDHRHRVGAPRSALALAPHPGALASRRQPVWPLRPHTGPSARDANGDCRSKPRILQATSTTNRVVHNPLK